MHEPTVAAPKASALRERSESPSKFSAGIAPKGGAGKNYQPSRIFDNDENAPSPERGTSADQFNQTNGKKYKHFDFADGSDPQDAPQAPPTPSALTTT